MTSPEAAPRPWPPERPAEVPPDAERCNWWAGRCEWPVHGDEHQHYTEYRGGVWREAEAAAGTALLREARGLLARVLSSHGNRLLTAEAHRAVRAYLARLAGEDR